VALIWPVIFGELPANPLLSIAALTTITVVAFWIAVVLARRRFLK